MVKPVPRPFVPGWTNKGKEVKQREATEIVQLMPFLRSQVLKLNPFPLRPSPETQLLPFISSAASPDAFGETHRPSLGHSRGFLPVPNLYVCGCIPPTESGNEASDIAV